MEPGKRAGFAIQVFPHVGKSTRRLLGLRLLLPMLSLCATRNFVSYPLGTQWWSMGENLLTITHLNIYLALLFPPRPLAPLRSS